MRVDVGLLLDPWAAVATALSSNGHNVGQAIFGALPSYDPDTQAAVISAISTLAATMAQATGQPLRIDQTVGLSSGQSRGWCRIKAGTVVRSAGLTRVWQTWSIRPLPGQSGPRTGNATWPGMQFSNG